MVSPRVKASRSTPPAQSDNSRCLIKNQMANKAKAHVAPRQNGFRKKNGKKHNKLVI
jgi:hypothetical protein